MQGRSTPELEALRQRFSAALGHGTFQPPVDVYATSEPETLHVRMELAGLDRERLAVELEGRLLRIAGERSPGHGARVRYSHMEIDYGPFERRIELPVDIDVGKVSATYADGFLTVSLPVARRPRAERMVIVQVFG